MTTVAYDVGASVPRRASRMVRRQAVWRPAFSPFVVVFAAVLALTWWTYDSDVGPVGWVMTAFWTIPTGSSVVGMTGALLTRRRMRRQRRWGPPRPAMQDILLVVVPTIGRLDTYPALERSVVSYCQFLPK